MTTRNRSAPKNVTATERARIIELARAGESRNAIVRTVGRSAFTVSKIAREAGVSFDRSAVAAATEAKRIDYEAEQERLRGRMLQAANDSLDALNGQDARGRQALMIAAGIAVDKALALGKAAREDDGAEAGIALAAVVDAARAEFPDTDGSNGEGSDDGAR